MGAAEAPSSAGRQAAGGRSSQRRGRAALDGGNEAIQAGCRGGGGTGPCCLGHSGQRATPAG